MDRIIISDLEVYFQVGVTDEERATPQRLLVTIEIAVDFTAAAASDNLAQTVDYYAVSQRVRSFGVGCHWQLIETLAADLAAMILDEFRPEQVSVEVKKFIIPQTNFVAVRLVRQRRQ